MQPFDESEWSHCLLKVEVCGYVRQIRRIQNYAHAKGVELALTLLTLLAVHRNKT